MNDILTFATREEFRNWLSDNFLSEDGVWLLFGKPGGPKTLKAGAVTEDQIAALSAILAAYEPAYTNFQAMSPFVKKTYTKAYLDAKTDAGRENRIAWMVDRLNRNLKPM